MIIKVHTVSGRVIEIEVEPNMTIGAIKEEFHRREGIPPIQQRVLFRGMSLLDDMSIEAAGITDGQTLHMVLSLIAG